MRNITLKIISLLLAILIWLYVYGGKKSVFFRDVPVDFLNLPSEKVILEASAFSVKIKLSGAKRVFETVKPSIRAEIDLSYVRDGLNIIEINPKNIKAPPYVKILSVSPQTVEVKIDSIIKKSLPVIAEIPVDEDFVLSDLKVIPSEVSIELPKTYTPDQNSVVVRTGKRCNSEGNFSYQVPVPLNSENLINITPNEIRVKWTCERKIESAVINGIPVLLKNKKKGMKYVLKPAKINLKIKGWSKELKGMDMKKEIEVSLDVGGYNPGEYEVLPEIKIPQGLELLEGGEKRLRLVVK